MEKDIQAMEIQKGLNNKSSGTYDRINLVHCISTGTIVVHFSSGDEAVSLSAGDDRTVNESITISSGSFDLNR